MDQNNLFIHSVIRKQAPILEENIDDIKIKLSKENSRQHKKNLEITQNVEETFLFEGYREYFENLVPLSNYSSLKLSDYNNKVNPFPTVLAHNDIHQNNILMRMSDNRDLLLIDLEYAGWNPMAMDLAVYINECMINNSHPGNNGVKEYLENEMSE